MYIYRETKTEIDRETEIEIDKETERESNVHVKSSKLERSRRWLRVGARFCFDGGWGSGG
ncbi:hypothetical protein LguiA_020376 [Lonicera macranthoides]